MRSVIDTLDLSVEEIDELIATALDMIQNPAAYEQACKGKKLATLFFEPSIRTRLSFEAAMYELGGHVLSMPDAASSSIAKGESVADTAKVISHLADIIVIRHPKEGAALVAARNASVPVINAGDGGHFHPTQTLADLLTIYQKKGGFRHLTVGLCGDLKYGRTVHSLISALSRYDDIHFVFIAPDELQLPDYAKRNISFSQTNALEEALPRLDILYMTRIQRERFQDKTQYERLKNSYILDADKMKLAKPDCIVMHPLPRVNEISVDVDRDPRACYFDQVYYGKYMRMALILKLLNGTTDGKAESPAQEATRACANPRCITTAEPGLPPLCKRGEDGKTRCLYCEAEVGG